MPHRSGACQQRRDGFVRPEKTLETPGDARKGLQDDGENRKSTHISKNTHARRAKVVRYGPVAVFCRRCVWEISRLEALPRSSNSAERWCALLWRVNDGL